MSRPLPRTSRRAALGALLATTATGCALQGTSTTSPASTDVTRSTAGTAAGTSTLKETKRTPAGTPSVDPGSADPDSDLVALVVAELSDAHARV
ncbi:hypothetical protein, partial [Nocardioides sp.]|uniref:hypothetical protein n=1 Tax=Nocardioides sp. TaxID=35761 RepID=UPI002B274758